MDGTCSMHGEEERCIKVFGEEAWGKGNIWRN